MHTITCTYVFAKLIARDFAHSTASVTEHKWSCSRAPRDPSCDTERVVEVRWLLYQPKASTLPSPSLAKIVELHPTYLALEEDKKLHCTTQNCNSSRIQGVVIETPGLRSAPSTGHASSSSRVIDYTSSTVGLELG